MSELAFKRRSTSILDNGNEDYIDTYINIATEEGRPNTSIQQYTSRVGQFARWLDRDLLTVTHDDIDAWCSNGNEYKRNHITAFFKTMLQHNVENFQSKIDKDLLIHLAIH